MVSSFHPTSLQKGCYKIFWETNHYSPRIKAIPWPIKSDQSWIKYRASAATTPFKECKGTQVLHKACVSGYVLSDSYVWAWLFHQCMPNRWFISLPSRNKSNNKTTRHLGIEIKFGFWSLRVRVQRKTKIFLLITSKLLNKCSQIQFKLPQVAIRSNIWYSYDAVNNSGAHPKGRCFYHLKDRNMWI